MGLMNHEPRGLTPGTAVTLRGPLSPAPVRAIVASSVRDQDHELIALRVCADPGRAALLKGLVFVTAYGVDEVVTMQGAAARHGEQQIWLTGVRVLSRERRRRAPRSPLPCGVLVLPEGGHVIVGTTTDLSWSGCRLEVPGGSSLRTGERVEVNVEVDPRGRSVVTCAADVVWRAAEGRLSGLWFGSLGESERDRLSMAVLDSLASNTGFADYHGLE